MKGKFTFLLTAFLLMFSYAGLAQVVSGTTYSTPNVSGLPEGWSGADGEGTTYMKLIAPTHYIQTAVFEQEGFTSITLKARKYGGPSEAEAKITVSWYDENDEETVLGTIDPTNTTLSNYTINTPTAENGTGYIKIQCKGAPETAGRGSGVSEVTITYTAPGGITPTTYTVTYNANVTGVAPVVDTYAEGADVTLRPSNTFTYEGHLFSEWNTQADGDGDAYSAGDVISDIQANIDLYAIWEAIPANENWILTDLADLTEDDIFVIVGNNGSDYAMANDGGTSSAPTAVAVTITGNEITSGVTANIQWNMGRDTTDAYIFYPNGSTTTWLYCFNNNNGLRVGTGTDKAFVINEDYLYNVGQGRYIGIYNSENWRSYTSINNNITGQTFSFFKKVTDGVVPPSISAEDVFIEYNTNRGIITYTINNEPDPAGTLSASTASAWLTLAGSHPGEILFRNFPNQTGVERTAIVTLTYTYNREITTKDVTVTQGGNPNVTMTIADVRAQGTGSVVTKGIVTSCVGTTGYIQDNTAAICVYGAELTVGDEIRVSGTLSTYNGLLEIINPEFTVVSQNNTVEPTVRTIAEINADYAGENAWQGWYVTLEDVTVTAISGQNTTVAQGENTIVVRSIPSTVTYAVNDILTLDGNIGCFNAAQIANPQNVQVQTLAVPTITVAPATVSAPFAGKDGTLTVTYQNITEVLAEVYFCDAEGQAATYDWIDADIDDENNVYYVIDANEGAARTAYLKVYALGDNAEDVYSNLVTINQDEYVAPTYAVLPFVFDGGKAAIDTIDGLYQEGLGGDYNNSPKLKFDHTGDWLLLQFNEEPGKLTYCIKGNSFSDGTFTVQTSANGETYTDLVEYTNLGSVDTVIVNLNADVRYIKWVYTEKVNGNVALGNIHVDLPSTAPVITVAPAMVEVTNEGGDGTLTVTYENIAEILAEVYFCNAQGEAATYDWIDADIDAENNVYYFIDANEGAARTAYLKVYALGNNAQDVYSNLVTINQAAYVPPFTGATYSLTNYIQSGRRYIIVGMDGENAYAMGGQNSNNRAGVPITIEDNVAQVSSPDVVEFVFTCVDGGLYSIYDDDTVPGYLYAASSGSNHLKTRTFDTDANSRWTFDYGEPNLNAVITAQGDHTHNLMRFNPNNGNPIFSCYTGGQQPVYLYVKDEEEPTYTIYKDIIGYGQGNGNWRLISSPVGEVNPENMENMLDNSYDLYAFDQSAADAEWQNYKVNTFNLAEGQGYLYANSQNVTLKWEGTPNNDEHAISLAYDANSDYPGWNLVGNPLSVLATIDKEDFYVMNDEGTELVLAERSEVNPMEGIFVKADGENETVIFDEYIVVNGQGWWGDPDKAMLNLHVTDGNGNSDFARIRFSEGRNFDKFMLHANSTKLYFTMDNEDYAVVYADKKGELPVNFKAAADGTYTLTIDAGNMEMDYLHLIDNMTGDDIDLLANPSYSFEARVNDNANRFNLVFVTHTQP